MKTKIRIRTKDGRLVVRTADITDRIDDDGRVSSVAICPFWNRGRTRLQVIDRDAEGAIFGDERARTDVAHKRLEYLRGELRAECISYGELAELESLAEYIDSEDVELLEAAGIWEAGSTYRIHISTPLGGSFDVAEVGGEFVALHDSYNGNTKHFSDRSEAEAVAANIRASIEGDYLPGTTVDVIES